MSKENPNAIELKPEEEIAKQIDNALTISGVYQTKEKTLYFSAYEIELSDGTKFNYDDYRELNEFLDPCDTAEDFELKGNLMAISNLKYKKIED